MPNHGTIILKCNCKDDYQDEKYGKNRRVHNMCDKGARCVTCGTERGASQSKEEK